MYQCESDPAVSISTICDGIQDCPTFGDDEVNQLCPGIGSCMTNEKLFRQNNHTQYIELHRVYSIDISNPDQQF